MADVRKAVHYHLVDTNIVEESRGELYLGEIRP